MSATAAVSVKRSPKPRDRNVVGTFEAFTREQVVAMLVKTNWAVIPTRLLADRRVFDSAAMSGVVDVVVMFTLGRVLGPGSNGKLKIKGGNPTEYSPTLITSDFAKILGISKRQALKKTTACVESGFLDRRGTTGQARVQYRVNWEAIRKAPNAKDPDQIERALAGRVRAAESRRDLEVPEADCTKTNVGQTPETKEAEGGACRTGVPHPPSGTPVVHLRVKLLPGAAPQPLIELSTPGGETARCDVQNELAIPADVITKTAANGNILIRIVPPQSTTKGEPTGSPAPADARSRIASTAELAAGLATRKLPVAPDFAGRLLKNLQGAPVPYFLQVLDRQIRAAVSKRKPFQKSWLPQTARDAVGEWPTIEAEERKKKRHATARQEDDDRKTAQAILEAPPGETAYTKEDRAWAREILAKGVRT